MVQLAEGVIKAVGCQWLVFGAFAHQLIVIVIVDDGRGHEVCGTGVCEGIGCQIDKFIVEGIPFLEQGGVVITLDLIEVAVVIIGLY